jgi:cell division protein FtsI/penicillin-binding protein 2
MSQGNYGSRFMDMPKSYRGNMRVISLWIFQKENAHEHAHITNRIIIREACNCYFIKLQRKNSRAQRLGILKPLSTHLLEKYSENRY